MASGFDYSQYESALTPELRSTKYHRRQGDKYAANVSYNAQMQTNYQNYKIAQMNNEYNYLMWEKENEYNSPAAQRQRYEEAGLNPYMMMGNQSGGNATSSPEATDFDFKAPYLDPSAYAANLDRPLAIAQLMQQGAETISKIEGQNISNQYAAAKSIAEINHLSSQAHSQEASARYNNIMSAIEEGSKSSTLATRQYSAQLAEQNAREVTYRNVFNELRSKNANQIVSNEIAQQVSTIRNIDADTRYKEAAARVSDKQIDLIASEIGVNHAKVRELLASAAQHYQEITESAARVAGVEIDNDIKRSTKTAVINKTIRDSNSTSNDLGSIGRSWQDSDSAPQRGFGVFLQGVDAVLSTAGKVFSGSASYHGSSN